MKIVLRYIASTQKNYLSSVTKYFYFVTLHLWSNTSSARIDINVLSAKLETETLVNSDMYMNFINAEDRAMALANGLNDYIVHKKYDTAFGDLVPIIIANALSVNLLIITQHVGVHHNEMLLCSHNREAHTRTLMLYKTDTHYDAIVPVGTVSNGDSCRTIS